jgi:hypothetical protein
MYAPAASFPKKDSGTDLTKNILYENQFHFRQLPLWVFMIQIHPDTR